MNINKYLLYANILNIIYRYTKYLVYLYINVRIQTGFYKSLELYCAISEDTIQFLQHADVNLWF